MNGPKTAKAPTEQTKKRNAKDCARERVAAIDKG